MNATERPLSLTVGKAIILIVLLGWVAYANSFTKSFQLDDILWILNNDDLPDWRKNVARHMQRPVVALSLTMNWKLGGVHPIGYHLVNALIHIGAALALFGVVRRTLLLPRWRHDWDDMALPLAFATAAIWIVHPLNTHSVTYLIQRCESGMGLCYVLSLYFLIRGSQSPRPLRWYLGSVAAAWVGVGCKEVAITIVLVAMLYDRVFLSVLWQELMRRRWPLYLGLASVLALPLRSHLGGLLATSAGDQSVGFDIPNLDPKTYFLTELSVLPYYLRLAVWPAGLCFDYRDWPPPSSPLDYLPGGIFLTALFLACVYGCFRRNGFAFLGMASFIILSLTSSFLPLLDVANEYRMYLPLMALTASAVIGGFLVLARLWPNLARQRLALAAVLAPIVACLLVVTFLRNEDYRTPLALWEDTLEKRPANTKVLHFIGAAHEMDGNWQEAKEKHLLCLQYHRHFFSMADLGLILYREGKTKEGIEYLEKAFATYNTHADTTTLLGTFYHLDGQSKKALGFLEFAKSLDPHKALPRFHKAQVLAEMGDADAARAEFDEAVLLFPDWPERFQKFARARLRGRFGDSQGVRRETLFYASIAYASNPTKTLDILTTLADAFAWNDRFADAVVPLREAIALSADQPTVRRKLEEKLKSFELKVK